MKNKLLLIPALALVLSAAACGGDKDKASDPPTSGTTPAGPATAQPSQPAATPSATATNGGGGGGSAYASDMEKVAACMRAKGYDAQVPQGGNIPILKGIKDQAKASADLKKCQEKILTPPGG
ncbi:hypothetical protein [Actinomadura rayongensis]|uniref:DUF732 domain-containing protein n=1 Tax=Actinomadura rayongensis TaxID=1429076 RepID=A0A6I4W939_9ACTN|nr:hypothetical protein [Actinomadura rayongensis]MXQ64785.1 hypothetical protein [Actinomadura rayongensis]